MQVSRTQPAAGPSLSRIAFGLWRMQAWQLSTQALIALTEQCIEMGITTTDHADIYGGYRCEALFGAALAAAPGLRQRIEVVSKCGIKLVSPERPAHQLQHYDTSAAHIIASAERSLRNLHTDYLDLLLIHRPDPLMQADEVARAFDALRSAGKVRHFGVSNFTPAQFDLLASRCTLVTNQIEASVLHLEPLTDGTLDQCQQHAITPMIWSALGGGRLFSEQSERTVRVSDTLTAIGHLHQVSASVIAYAWLLQLPSQPSVLTGSGRLAALRDAARACTIELTREQWFQIWIASTGHGVA
ncbi:MAG: aldo/keto reductase [Pseudomonadota bacterium]|nr:aldo/keto reductase [Pseudomonadota bacterium]